MIYKATFILFTYLHLQVYELIHRELVDYNLRLSEKSDIFNIISGNQESLTPLTQRRKMTFRCNEPGMPKIFENRVTTDR